MFYTGTSTKTKMNKNMNGAFDLYKPKQEKVVIKVISVSEGGEDALRNMEKQMDGVDFVYFDAIENTNIREILNDANLVFLIGATDDSKINVISEIALELNILTIAVVTTWISDASKNITQLLCHVDEGKTRNDALLESIQGITDCLVHPGMINVDLSDLEQVLAAKSRAIFSIKSANGDNRARDAIEQALASPLFQQTDLKNASAVFVNIAASDMSMGEFSDVGGVIEFNVSENTRIKIGMSIDENLGEVMRVAVVVAV
jgi:cell division protein FtsZ